MRRTLDGRFVAFFSGGQLKRVDIAGGAVRTISDAPMQPVGGSWNRDGVILIGSAEGPLARVAAEGGTPSAVTALRGASGHTYPEFLPDGRHFLFLTIAAGGTRSVAMGTLDDDTVVDVGASESKAAYAAPYLLRVLNGELVANRFDIGSRTLAEERIVLTNGIAGNPNGTATFAISGGTLAYRRTARASLTQLTWVDRTGSRLGAVGDPDDQMQVRLSPDGTHAAVSVFDPEKTTREVWIYDLARNVRSRFTLEGSDAFTFAWSPDGAQLVYSAVRPPSSLADLFIRPVDGAGAEHRVLEQPATGNRYAQAWSSGSDSVLFGTGSAGSATGNDIWVVSLDGKAPRALVQTPFNERAATVSPDGRWLAYESNESGRFELYVQAMDGGRKWLVSSGGGTWPRWRRDGRELFYIDGTGALVSVPVTMGGSSFESGPPAKLFEARLRTEGYKAFASGYSYDVLPDGSRFLLNLVVGESESANLTVTTNWTDSLSH